MEVSKMDSIMAEQECPIWGTPAQYSPTTGDLERISSERAGGEYELTGTAEAILLNWGDDKDIERAALSQNILEANLNGSVLRLASDDLAEGSSLLRLRKRRESLTLFVRTVAYHFPRMGEPFLFGVLSPSYPATFAAAVGYLERSLGSFYHTLIMFVRRGVSLGFFETRNSDYYLSFQGFELVEDLGLTSRQGDKIFVAMWFGSQKTNDYFIKAVKPAIEAAGYTCVRIDERHHNERIDEQILAEIRDSKAVFVDITCGIAAPIEKPSSWSKQAEIGAPRGGVYFEAGFAAGLGKPIIWSVDNEVAEIENVVHFDVRQYNQIRWKSDHEKNRDFLRARIEATLGKGSSAF